MSKTSWKNNKKYCTILAGYYFFDIINTLFPSKTFFKGGNTIRLEGFGVKHALEIVMEQSQFSHKLQKPNMYYRHRQFR